MSRDKSFPRLCSPCPRRMAAQEEMQSCQQLCLDTDWALLRHQDSVRAGSSWRNNPQQGGGLRRAKWLGCPWRKSLFCSLSHGPSLGGDQVTSGGCDVLLASPSSGRVSGMSTVDDISLMRIEDITPSLLPKVLASQFLS